MAPNGSALPQSTTTDAPGDKVQSKGNVATPPLPCSGLERRISLGCYPTLPSVSLLRQEGSGESTLLLSQTSDYFEAFDNSPGFWSCAVQIDADESQVETPPTSSSSSASTGSGPHTGSDSSSRSTGCGSSSLPAARGGRLKRTPSQASIKPNESNQNNKRPRIGTFDQPSASSSEIPPADCPFINLSPPQRLQSYIDSRALPYSTQWELARHVNRGLRSWDTQGSAVEIAELDRLRSKTNSEGAKNFAKVFYNEKPDADAFASLYDDERKATDPWPELDREEKFATDHPDPDEIDHRGGRVHFYATLKKPTTTTTKDIYKIELNPARLGASNSFSRRFGSKSFLHLKIPTPLLYQQGSDMTSYLRKPLILCQHVFRAFYAKEQTVYYFRTNEVWNAEVQLISPPSSSSSGIGFLDFIKWHNPIELNYQQTMAKWASRFALGLSPSLHGFTLSEREITDIQDIKSEEGSDMSDGAGYITRRLLQHLTLLHDWPTRPSAIQVRVRGSKGLLVENPDSTDETLGIQLRPSLVKIRYPSPLDATHRTIDILRRSHARTPIRISADVIVNLHENGVNIRSLKQLMEKSIDEIVRPLLDWDSDDCKAMRDLWINYERAGSVIKSRRAREDVALARVNGFTEFDAAEDVKDEDGEAGELEEAAEHSAEWFPDKVSGCPSGLEETIIELLDSGFRPATCAILREKAYKVVQATINRAIANYTIELPFSAGAWIIPDPSGLLETEQVFFQCSQGLPALDGTETNILTGDVLITRDPCRLPTDVQKWKAVDIPELHQYKDVIILSVRGPRRAADWLAGGDYDGDKAKLIWQPDLVKDFKNADPGFADPPPDLDLMFAVENKRVSEFLTEVEGYSEEQTIYEMQKYLLGTLKNLGMVGQYSNFHDISTYTSGYKSEETKLLAYMFTTVLDGRKTGKTVRQDVYKTDCERFKRRRLNWKEQERKHVDGQLTSGYNAMMVNHNPSFIMEKLSVHGRKLKEKKLHDIEEKMRKYDSSPDPALTRPYMELLQDLDELRSNLRGKSSADMIEADLQLIQKHVENTYNEHKDVQRQSFSGSNLPGATFTSQPIGKRQDVLRMLSKHFHSKPEKKDFGILSVCPEFVNLIKASYAYYYDSNNRRPSRFPWNVAFRILCAIKCGRDAKHLERHFYDNMIVKRQKHSRS